MKPPINDKIELRSKQLARQNDMLALAALIAVASLILSVEYAHSFISEKWIHLYNPFFLIIPTIIHISFNHLEPWKYNSIKPKVYMTFIILLYFFSVPPLIITMDDRLNGFFSTLLNVMGGLYSIGLLNFFGFFLMIFFFNSYILLLYKIYNINFDVDDLFIIPMGLIFLIIGSVISEVLIRVRIREKKQKNFIKVQGEKNSALLTNLGQGFMVMDKNGVIEEGATKITEKFFNTYPVGKKLSEVLNLDGEKSETLEKWLKNIYREVLTFKDLRLLGPQSFESKGRYIDLDYKPIYAERSKRKIDKVICVATDKTHEVELEKQLELDKQNAEFINSCLQNPVEFVDLMDDTFELLEAYPTIKEMDEGELFRKFHTLKARYGQFGVKDLTYYINEVETGISKKEFDNLDSKVDKFESELQEFVKKNRLIIEAANKFMIDQGNAVQVSDILDNKEQFSDLENLFNHLRENYLLSDIKGKFERYGSLVDELAEKQSKVIDAKFTGDEIKVDTNKYSNFINTSIHLFRNMVDHGIETEDERIEKTKPQRGSIKVEFKNNGDTFIIQMADDGSGIDPKRIKDKVLEKGLKLEEDLQNLKDSDLVDMIFLPGFSTKEEVTDVSGRGVGMDAVREEVERLGGTISVSSKIDEGTKFKIKLPILG
ncbi:ATP-binding protein [Bacteriovoracales bacterium]|nr:ATP-binding protein [Bacteriovoracales bacterium]